MSDVINSIFGRPRTDVAPSGEPVQAYPTQPGGPDLAVIPETVDTEAIEDVTEDSASTAADVEPTEAEAVEAEPTDHAPVDGESDEATMDDEPTDVTAEDGEIAEDSEIAEAAESDDAPAVAETDDVDQVELVVEPVAEPATAGTRPAAGVRGSTTVGDGVVAKIVAMVAGRTDGVHSIDDEGISVEADDDVATIRISLVVEYGHPIKALAERVRTDVIEAVEQFFSLDVAAVDIHVSDIHQPVAD